MENNKYYVPNAKDLHVGYEMEVDYGYFTNAELNTWYPVILKGVDSAVLNYLEKGYYRTPFLTKEQIENEGWETEFNTSFDSVLFYAQRGNLFKLIYNYDTKILDIWTNDSEDDRIVGLFRGECKSINEFRYICKLLNIK